MRQRGGSVEKIEEEVAGHLNVFIFGRRLRRDLIESYR